MPLAEFYLLPRQDAHNETALAADELLTEVVIPASPLRFSAQPEPLDLVAPLLGEHTGEVLREWLGYSAEEIEALRKDAAI